MNFVEQRWGNRGAVVRLAALLLVIALSIVASKIGEGHFIQTLRKDCHSLFADRLMPATTLFELSDAIYQKRDVLITHLRQGPDGNEDLQYRLGAHDADIEQHIAAIEKTYLVADEVRLLQQLRASLKNYASVEGKLIAQRKAGQHTDRLEELSQAFDELRQELLNLTRVQESVGQQLKSDSLSSAGQVTTLLYFQLGIAFALGIVASGLAMSLRPQQSRSIAPPPDQLH
jgi:hypothetical protein